jgi:hypothetical protein
VRLAAILPLALSDTTAVTGAGEIIVAGGLTNAATPIATIYAVKVRGSLTRTASPGWSRPSRGCSRIV